jgi:hypothetical protein
VGSFLRSRPRPCGERAGVMAANEPPPGFGNDLDLDLGVGVGVGGGVVPSSAASGSTARGSGQEDDNTIQDDDADFAILQRATLGLMQQQQPQQPGGGGGRAVVTPGCQIGYIWHRPHWLSSTDVLAWLSLPGARLVTDWLSSTAKQRERCQP